MPWRTWQAGTRSGAGEEACIACIKVTCTHQGKSSKLATDWHHACSIGLEDEQDDAAPRAERREMRYDDEGLDSEDDFIDDDIGDGGQGRRASTQRAKGRTAGVHNQAVQVPLMLQLATFISLVSIVAGLEASMPPPCCCSS